ncbi:mucin-17-like [Heterocephalus glaber]|uniref:Mucin-17-like n=1 Tax=Heterocephalus glaber TaxID=10181 RepID=A0AAX6SMT7_HETGA|nr:mucin-17-like [Heterocephalus glaber]
MTPGESTEGSPASTTTVGGGMTDTTPDDSSTTSSQPMESTSLWTPTSPSSIVSTSGPGTTAPLATTIEPGTLSARVPVSSTLLFSGSVTPYVVNTTTNANPSPPGSNSTAFPISSTLRSTVIFTTSSRPTTIVSPTTSVSCLNGGTWTGEACVCPNGFKGDRCQYADAVCNNGGSWDGLKCQCPTLFYGPKCDFVVDGTEMPLPKMASALVNLTMTVTSKEYSDKLQDRSSKEFKNFNATFTEQMDLIYAGIPEYEGVNITSLRAGSVVVEHNIILKTSYTLEYKQVLEKASQQVEEKILNATKVQITSSNNTCSAYLLCFNSTATVVQNVTIVQYDPEQECREMAGTYAAYFTVEYKDQQPYCITPCMPGFNASLDCHYGKCQLQPSGPRCK